MRFSVKIVLAATLFLLAAAAPAAGEPLVVATKETPPFAIRGDDGSWTGITIDLWDRVASDLELDYELRESDLDGMLRGLGDGSLDAGVAAMTVTADREEQVDFTHPFYSTGLAIAIRSNYRSGWIAVATRFLSPRFLTVVLALGLLLLVAGFLVWLFERRVNDEMFGGATPHGIGAGFWWAAVTMTTVGYGDKAPQTFGGRVVALIWMFASLIVISTFTASIASALTVGSLRSPIEGPDDLHRGRLAGIEGTTSEAYLRGRGLRVTSHDGVAEAMAALRDGEVDAVVHDAPILRYQANRAGFEELAVLPGVFERQDYAIALPPDSPLREPITRAVLKVVGGPEWDEILARYLGE